MTWTCDWTPDDLNPGPECPYCAGQMCARMDGLGCWHNREERHGYGDALAELDWLEGYLGHQVFEDGSDGFDHLIPIRAEIERLRSLVMVYEPVYNAVRDAPGAHAVAATILSLSRKA